MQRKKVYFVGAGPADPGLITVKGREILGQAEVIIYDYLVDKRILDEVGSNAELICCDTLGKKRYSDGYIIHQEKINQLIIRKVKEGKKVVRLKNGDPAVFSRLSQELEILKRNKIEYEIVPGVTAASAASAFSGIPLTERSLASSCVLATGHEDPAKETSLLDWEGMSRSGTLVLYMGVENLSRIVKVLLKVKKKETPVAIIANAGGINQKTIIATLKDILPRVSKAKIKPPTIIIVGEVVRLEKRFNWFKKTKKILFTGISSQRFFSRGLFFHLPLIKILPLKDYTQFDRQLKLIADYDWIVFSSRFGVQYFFQRLNAIGYDSRNLSRANIAAIGNSTANKLSEFGILADLIPKIESSQGLLEAFKKYDLKDKKIFIPRSDISDKGLALGFKAQGAGVTAIVAYRNTVPDYLPHLDLSFLDKIIFTSPSGVRNFVKRYGRLPKKVKISCIGKVTKDEARKQKLMVDSV